MRLVDAQDAQQRDAALPSGLALAALDASAVPAALDSRLAGLTEPEAQARLVAAGPNRIATIRRRGLARRFLAQFTHLFALLLWAGSGLAFLVGMASTGLAVIAVILLNGVFGFVQEYRAERAVAALQRLLPPLVTVRRDGVARQVAAELLVPGDVLLLAEGDRVAADARLVEAADLRLDESSLSGEHHPVHKAAEPEREVERSPLHLRNVVFAGSTIVGGSGMAVVFATGMATEFGRIARLTQAVPEAPSPLQVEVDRVARRVALLSVAMGVGFFLIGHALAGLQLRDGAIFGVGIVLGNVPEGLLPTMTLALAMGVQRMARRHAVVKQLASVETLGACSVICTDKTGTLTTNQMTVREVWASGRRATMSGTGYGVDGAILADGAPADSDQLAPFLPALRIGQLCNTAQLRPPDAEGGNWQVLGDPTEGALLVAAVRAGLDREAELQRNPPVRRLAFDSQRKRMSTLHQAPEGDLIAFVKGAPRELLARCERALVDGREVALGAELGSQILAENDRMARAGLRVLAMAYRPLPPEERARALALGPGDVEQGLVFAGLVGMQDPPRTEVPAAVARCREAGIRIIMLTGDYGLTAETIARQVGIVGQGPHRVIDGDELEAMSEPVLAEALASGQLIFARISPEHKLRVVTALQRRGEVVAVTGDGVNDAPALKQADIGVAMGLVGTDVAREAADMVLTDDNFATIVAAVEEGRAIFDNMRKFIVYIFAHLAPEAIPFIIFALFHTPLPLTVMQILAIDLGTETLPALALGVERPEPDVMRRPPRARKESLLGAAALLRGYGFLGLLTSAVVLTAFLLYLHTQGWVWGHSQVPSARAGREAATLVFLGIVLMQVGNAFACRTERISLFRVGLWSNRLLLWGIVFELAFAAALIYVPLLQPIFGTAAVAPGWWLFLLAFVPLIFLAEEGRKAAVRWRSGTSMAAGAGPRSP